MNKIMMEKLKKSSLEALAEVSYLILHAMWTFDSEGREGPTKCPAVWQD